MPDQFETTIRRFLCPIDQLTDGPSDAMYFLHAKGGLVYCEGYAHPPHGLYGCLIKYPDPNGHINIFGRHFNWTHRRYENGTLVIVPYKEQVRRQEELFPELATRPPCPPYADHFSHYLLNDMRGFFDAKKSLKILMGESPRLREVVGSLDELLGIPLDRIGCNGSLAYGYFVEPHEDVDVIFFGSVRENFAVIERIRALKKKEPARECYELGKTWPLRFHHMGTVICPFFKYSRRDEIPLTTFTMNVIKGPVEAHGVVSNDLHTGYLPAVLGLDRVTIDRKAHPPLDLIVYDGSQRGEYFRGDGLKITGRLVRIARPAGTREALLVTLPTEVTVEKRGAR
ncbi:MAG: hypothetical protein NT045_06190 [Candidatus Aureabacteria bacterium]|nr:hypothetical protein [Candidatus Auribacterota bacterium]